MLRQAIAITVTVATLVAALWQEMQWLALVALACTLGAVYRERASSFLRIIERQIPRVTKAKFSEVEFSLAELLGEDATGISGIAGKALRIDELFMLQAVAESGRHRLTGSLDNARRLRDLGLVEPSESTMGASDYVTLTTLGQKVSESFRSEFLSCTE